MSGIKEESMFKQYIVVRNDLPMSAGKLAAQVSHGSLSFFSWMVLKHLKKTEDGYEIENMKIDKALWDDWLDPEHASFTKVVLAVKNKKQLEKIKEKAMEAGFIENEDFFCIHDEGRTELNEWRDEDGRIFTCIGFRPMEENELKSVVGKLQLYHG